MAEHLCKRKSHLLSKMLSLLRQGIWNLWSQKEQYQWSDFTSHIVHDVEASHTNSCLKLSIFEKCKYLDISKVCSNRKNCDSYCQIQDCIRRGWHNSLNLPLLSHDSFGRSLCWKCVSPFTSVCTSSSLLALSWKTDFGFPFLFIFDLRLKLSYFDLYL